MYERERDREKERERRGGEGTGGEKEECRSNRFPIYQKTFRGSLIIIIFMEMLHRNRVLRPNKFGEYTCYYDS